MPLKCTMVTPHINFRDIYDNAFQLSTIVGAHRLNLYALLFNVKKSLHDHLQMINEVK